jgi:hypothetical protein
MDKYQGKRDCIVVARCPSSAFLESNEQIVITSQTSLGNPVTLTIRTRWIDHGEGNMLPGDLFIEIRGHCIDLETALAPFANTALPLVSLLTLSANAYVGEVDVEVGYDNTSGLIERDYFQNYLPPESFIIHSSNKINCEHTVKIIEAVERCTDRERIIRAINQYRLALSTWRFGRESLSLAHLWMAVEALTKATIRFELIARGLQNESELHKALNTEKKLDPAVRELIILQGDNECYKKALDASDGFEHGFLGYDIIRNHSKDVVHRLAKYVRHEIFRLCNLGKTSVDVLINKPYDQPLGHWPLVKYTRGKLLGNGEKLSAEGHLYPICFGILG